MATDGTKPNDVGLALIRGRITGKARSFTTREGVKVFETPVTLPAADEFSSPSTVPVRSRERLGDVGDTFSGRVRIGGAARSFTYTDKVSGESRQGLDFSVWLTVAE